MHQSSYSKTLQHTRPRTHKAGEGKKVYSDDDDFSSFMNESFLEKEKEAEAKVDAYMQRMQRMFESGERIEVGDIYRAPFELHCAEYWTQYIGHSRDWHLLQRGWLDFVQDWNLDIDHDVINDTKEEQEIAPGPSQMSGKIVLTAWHSPTGMYSPKIQRVVAPGLSTLFPMERPRLASLEPLPMKLRNWRQSEDGGRKQGADCRIWFLGHGCIRLEMDMQPYTGEPGKLMWSGLQLPSRQPYKHTIENKCWESTQADKGLSFAYGADSDSDDVISGDDYEVRVGLGFGVSEGLSGL